MLEYTFVTESLGLFLLFAFLGLAFFITALIGTYSRFRGRGTLLTLFFTAVLVASYFSLGELLGRAKPVDILTWDRPDVEEARVMAQFHKKDEGIWLLLMYKGLTVPRYYQFPWDEDMSRKLKRAEAAEQLEQTQGTMLKFPFRKSLEDRKFPEVHEIPWPAPPPKDAPTIEQIDLDSIDA